MEPDPHSLLCEVTGASVWGEKHFRLSEAIGKLIEDYSLVRFTPLNIQDEENLADVLITLDNMLQFGEDADVKTKDFDQPDDDE